MNQLQFYDFYMMSMGERTSPLRVLLLMVELKDEFVKILLSLHDVYGRGDLAPTFLLLMV